LRNGNLDSSRSVIKNSINQVIEAYYNPAPNNQSQVTPRSNKGQLKLPQGYESLNLLAETLITNKYFDQSTAKGRAALATALLIGGGEAFGKGTTRTDFFTYMGGTGDMMKGFAQFNTTIREFREKTKSPDSYMNLLGSMLTGERTLPRGIGRFNSAELASAVQQGKVTSGKQLIQFIQNRIDKVSWQGLYDGMRRVPGLADQLVNYLRNSQSVKPTKQGYATSITPKTALSESDRQTLISSSLGLSTSQLQKITKEYKQGTQTLDLVKQKVAQQTQNLNIQVEAGGDTPKPSDRPADPLANSIKAAPEVQQTGAVVKTESGVSVRIEKRVDDAHQIERAASPFPTRVNKEMASRESQGLSSFNSSGFMDLFGMADGWTSQQYA
jgi:hypothetical protein